ncbi:extracellular solute-binding protein [Ensifer sp. ENS07]|uniref:extracellular solute-binding protein n=1 Tax=Ensifer sp. ENS07 TaxID=2769274 RepID=UPI001AED9F04
MGKTLKSMLLSAAVFCAAAGQALAIDVEWWDFLSGGDGVRMKSLIEKFNKEHPDIQIKSTTLEWGAPYYAKVRTAVGVGQGPDIMTYHLSRLPLGLVDGSLSQITDEDLAAAGLAKADFFDSSVKAASSDDGKLYAVPFDIHAIVLFYNKKALEGTEYLDDKGNLVGIKSLDDFNAALAKLKEKGVKTPLSYQTAGGGGTWRVFYTLLSQLGGELITNGEVLAGDNAAKAEKAIEIMADWRSNDYTPEQAEYKASVALFSAGDAAFFMNGVWEVPTLKDLGANGKLPFDWSAVEIPQLLDKPATWADSHALAIPANKDESPEMRKAVLTVIGWMEKNSLSWAEAGHIPAYKATVESGEYQKLQPNATYASLANNAAFDPRSPIAGVASPVYDAVDNLVAPAVHGQLSPADAVAEMKATLQPLLQ